MLDVIDGKAEQTAQIMQESPGVVMADALVGPPDVIVVMEATERLQLTKLTVQAITSVDSVTENVHLLPVRDDFSRKCNLSQSRKVKKGE